MGRLIDADKIIFREIDEIGGEYEPYLGCSKSQINSLPTVEAIPKADYENRLKADLVAMLTDMLIDVEEIESREQWCDYANDNCISRYDVEDLIQQKINALRGENNG